MANAAYVTRGKLKAHFKTLCLWRKMPRVCRRTTEELKLTGFLFRLPHKNRNNRNNISWFKGKVTESGQSSAKRATSPHAATPLNITPAQNREGTGDYKFAEVEESLISRDGPTFHQI